MNSDDKFRLWFLAILFAGIVAIGAVAAVGNYLENISKRPCPAEQVK